MPKNTSFRGWYYFRMGWSTYFAFIFAAINTLTVTYFLAIDNYPILKEVFPTFVIYTILVACVGIPLLTFIGYIHFKRTPSYSAETAQPGFTPSSSGMIGLLIIISASTIKI